MKKKFDLKNSHTTTGKIWNESAGLTETVGHKKASKQKVSTAAINEYREKLEKMNKFDLEKHAVSMLVTPRDNRENLIAELVKEFGG